ncbi:MAG: hypothetical protein PHH11_08320 [Methylomonas sp.]|nr:hypothetical protein [Methylomonas sp.]
MNTTQIYRAKSNRLAVAILMAMGGGAQATPFVLTDLGTLGGTRNYVYGLNNSGQVVGTAHTADETVFHAVVSDANGGAQHDLGTLGGSISWGLAINNSGRVAGQSYTEGDASTQAFIGNANGGALRNLGTLGGTMSGVGGIDSSGRVVGWSASTGNSAAHAFISDANGGSLHDLGTLGGSSSYANAINDSGQVAGTSDTNGNAGMHAFISAANGGALRDLGTLGGKYSSAIAINNSGQVAGVAATTGDVANHAFVSDANGGALRDLGTFGGTNSIAYGINSSGQVVGGADTVEGSHAFLYTGTKMVDLTVLTGNNSLFDARAINDFGQIAVNGGHGFLLTLNPTWSANGSGNWENAANWNFGGAGALNGLTPGNPHDVAIHSATAANISGPSANTRVRSLALGGAGSSSVALNLSSGTLAANDGVAIHANGTLGGSGILQGTVTNAGQIQVTCGNRLQLTGAGTTNTGTVSVLGTAFNPAELDHSGEFKNSAGGRLVLQNALYRGGGTATQGEGSSPTTITGGLNNAGQILVTGSDNNIFGAIDQVAGGQLIVSGNGNATFYDTIKNNGIVKVSAGSTATFFGLVTGAGSYAGTGTSFYEGGFHVGNSPAVINIDNVSIFDTSSILSMDLAGLTPGGCAPGDCAHYAHINFNNDVKFNGGELRISLYNDFVPLVGEIFNLFSFNSTHSGSFNTLSLPTLAEGLRWNTDQLYSKGQLSVAAVPLPTAAWLFLSSLLGLLGLNKRSRR